MSDSDKPAQAIPGIQDLLDQRDTQAAVQRAADAQARTGRADTQLGDLGAGTDPDFVRTEEHFEGMTLDAMYAAVHGGADGGGMDAAGLKTLRQTLFDCYSELANASTFNLMGMNRIFGNGLWQGASGSAAQTASEQYSKVANQVARVFESLSGRLDSLAWAAEAVRLAVPAPPTTVTVGPDPDNTQQSVLPGLVNPSYSDQLDDAREEARQVAIRALNSVYKGNFPPAGSGVPTYLTVPELGGDQGPGVGNGSNTDGSGTNAPSTTGAEDTGSQQPTTPSAAVPSDSSPTTTTPAGTNTASTSGIPNNPNTTTTAAGLGNAPMSTGSGPGSGTPADAGHGTNWNTFGGPGTTSRPGGPGSSVPGVPGVAAPATGTSRAGGASSARSGIGSTGAPGAAGRRKEGEDDGTHHSPDYLRGVASDWTEGLDTPVEVIGEGFVPDGDPLFTAEPTWTAPPRPHNFSASPTEMNTAPTGYTPAEARTEQGPSTPSTPGRGAQTEAIPSTSAGGPQTETVPAPGDNTAAVNPATDSSGAKSAGFSGAGPSLDDLLSEYGWDMDTTADNPDSGADATAADDQTSERYGTAGPGSSQ